MREVAVAQRRATKAGVVERSRTLLQAHPVAAVFALALLARVVTALFLTRFFSGTLVFDDTTYHLMAQVAAAGETAVWDEFTHTLYWSTATLLLPITWLYKIFGPEMVAAQLYVATLGAAAAAATTRLALDFLPARWALFAGSVVAFLPSQVLWSSLLMKDAAVWIVLSSIGVVVAIASRSTGRRLVAMGLAAGVLLILLSLLRLHTLVVVSWALMLASLAGTRPAWMPRVLGAVALGIFIPWGAGQIGPAGVSLVMNHGSLEDRRFANAVGANTAIVDPAPDKEIVVRDGFQIAGPSDSQSVAELEEETAQLEERAAELLVRAEAIEERKPVRAEQLREEVEELREEEKELRALVAAANKDPAVGVPQPEAELLDPSIRHLPRGLSVMLVEPFPIPFDGTIALRMARLESLLWYPILGLAIVGLFRARRHLRAIAFPLLAGGGILLTYALAEGNIGTAHRHRGEFVWVVAVLAALGLKHAILGRRRTSSENT